MSTKVIIADNQLVFRTGTARLLALEDDMRIVGQCDNYSRLCQAAENFPGSLVLCASSISPPWAELLAHLSRAQCRLVAILENSETPHTCIKHGCPGVLYRDVNPQELVKCAHSVGRGRNYVQERVGSAQASLETAAIGDRARNRLTPKELKILRLLLQGYKNKDIAEELMNSEQVIKNYMRTIFDKTGTSDRLELALFALHHKVLLEPDVEFRPATPESGGFMQRVTFAAKASASTQ